VDDEFKNDVEDADEERSQQDRNVQLASVSNPLVADLLTEVVFERTSNFFSFVLEHVVAEAVVVSLSLVEWNMVICCCVPG